jgi:hypothetical protein
MVFKILVYTKQVRHHKAPYYGSREKVERTGYQRPEPGDCGA